VNIENFSIDEFRVKIFNREIDRIADFDEKLSGILELLDNEYDDLDENLEQLLVDYLESR
jgi:hypothetical protein